jgi:hypothetical protein
MGFAPGEGGTEPPAAAPSQDSLPDDTVRDTLPDDTVRHRADTGDARVDDALSRLDELTELPVAGHPAVFEYVHERLAEALGELDGRDHAQLGQEPSGPGSAGR